MRHSLCRICNRVIDFNLKYCSKCEPKAKAETKEKHKQYNRNRTDKDIVALYKTPHWNKIRDIVRARLKGLDIYSYYVLGKIEYADLYHHIVEVKDDRNKMYDIRNLIGLTNKNHAAIHGLYEKSEISKENTQKTLKNLLIRWNDEIRGGNDNF